MPHFRFNIADHLLAIDYHGSDDMRILLPSFAAFVVRGGTMSDAQPICNVRLDDSFDLRLQPEYAELGQFDCGGANHGVYRTADGRYRFEISDTSGQLCSIMHTDALFRNADVQLVATTPSSRAYALNNAVMMAYAFATVEQATLLMHASVIRNGGRGYLFLGTSGTGKSTHTRLWRENIPGSDLLNDDNPVVRVVDGEVRVYGTPWSGKTPCYRKLSASVGAMTLLEQKPYNKMTRQGIVGAFAAILPSASNMKWDARVHNAVVATVTQVIAHTPVYLMGCLPNADAARLSYKTVKSVKC